jgi:hypothetical protein
MDRFVDIKARCGRDSSDSVSSNFTSEDLTSLLGFVVPNSQVTSKWPPSPVPSMILVEDSSPQLVSSNTDGSCTTRLSRSNSSPDSIPIIPGRQRGACKVIATGSKETRRSPISRDAKALRTSRSKSIFLAPCPRCGVKSAGVPAYSVDSLWASLMLLRDNAREARRLISETAEAASRRLDVLDDVVTVDLSSLEQLDQDI